MKSRNVLVLLISALLCHCFSGIFSGALSSFAAPAYGAGAGYVDIVNDMTGANSGKPHIEDKGDHWLISSDDKHRTLLFPEKMEDFTLEFDLKRIEGNKLFYIASRRQTPDALPWHSGRGYPTTLRGNRWQCNVDDRQPTWRHHPVDFSDDWVRIVYEVEGGLSAGEETTVTITMNGRYRMTWVIDGEGDGMWYPPGYVGFGISGNDVWGIRNISIREGVDDYDEGEISNWQEYDGLGVGVFTRAVDDRAFILLENHELRALLASGGSEPGYLRGKPVSITGVDKVDLLQWIDMPYVATEKPSGSQAWDQGSVLKNSIHLDDASDKGIVVRTDGVYSGDENLGVSTRYALYGHEPWLMVESTFSNNSANPMEIFLGDVLRTRDVNPGVFMLPGPGKLSGSSPQEYANAGSWVAKYAFPRLSGIKYLDGDDELSFYGVSSEWMMSVLPVQIPAGDEYVLSRYIMVTDTEDALFAETAMESISSRINHKIDDVEISIIFRDEEIINGSSDVVTVRIENNSDEVISAGSVELTATRQLGIDETVRTFPYIQPGGSHDVEYAYDAEYTGRGYVTLHMTSADREYHVPFQSFFVGGAGWYHGDTHTHSVHSDGRGTIAENVASARQKGLAFMIASDHNTVGQRDDVAAENRDDFVAILANEVTMNAHDWGHAVASFITQAVDYNPTGDASNPIGDIQYTIDETLDEGGLYYIAHPFTDRERFTWKHWDVEGFTGLEAWNDITFTHEDRKAIDKWEDLLNDGYRGFGITGSDAHFAERVGLVRVSVFLNELSSEEIRHALGNGHFYGTNGPRIRFEANGAMMGETIQMKRGETLSIDISTWADSDIGTVLLIRNGETVNEWNPNSKEFSTRYDIAVDGDGWYRLEVKADDAGFAYTNPIWVEINDPKGVMLLGETSQSGSR